MSTQERSQNGILRERWDDATRTYTAYNASGVQTSTRAYTAAENATADAEALRVTQQANEDDIGNKIVTVDMPAMQAILDATNATINANPAAYIKDLAKAIRRLDRKVQRILDGSN